MNIYAVLLSILSLGLSAHAGNSKLQQLQKVLEHLRTGPGFHSKLLKKVHEGVQDKDSESSGEVYFSKGKMRMELEKPERILMVYDGEFAWQEQEFDDGEKKHAIVTKMKANSLKKDSAILAVLLGDGKFFKSFELTHEKESGGVSHYELKPKNKKITEVTLLRLDLKGDSLKALSYNDELENQVKFVFDNLKEEKVADKNSITSRPKALRSPIYERKTRSFCKPWMPQEPS